MPTYCYVTADGQTTEKVFPMGKAPETVKIGRRVARRDFRAELKGGMKPCNWPMVAEISCSIDADQVAEAVAYDKANGCRTEYVSVGDGEFAPKLENVHHYKRYMEAHGLYARNGGYNDPQRRTS